MRVLSSQERSFERGESASIGYSLRFNAGVLMYESRLFGLIGLTPGNPQPCICSS